MAHKKQHRTVFLKNTRLSFANGLFEARQVSQTNPQRTFSASFIIENGKTVLSVLKDGVKVPVDHETLSKEMLIAAFGAVNPKMKNWAFRSNADAVNAETNERYTGFEDDAGVHMAPKKDEKDGPPTFLNRNVQITLEEARKVFYGGCYVNAKINVATYAGDESKGITAYLVGLNFVSDGTPFVARDNADGLEDEDLVDADTI
jgi:hypothetical protein